ncbi:vitamin D-binding protein [Alosa sapidissima]|uniref:vitamin D-binding protein n=1 Tax=Alosa sapidissima TaxID=34773 RepID=UPI001C089948|nr:vitamin D-binding protein [Alosa sapidissima]
MKFLCFILISISVGWAEDSGLRYEKEKVCEQLHGMGKQKFKGLFIAVYSQKFPNSTLEEVTCLADEMLKLGERCCVEGSSADCYDKGATEISDKSCQADSPFPKHPGITRCCAKQDVHERKMCLASLHYSAEELPSLLDPTNEEMCEQYTQDPTGYSFRYMYELARRHRSAPTGLVLNATGSQLRMLEKCCKPAPSAMCFFTERFQGRHFNIFLRFTSNVCHNNINMKSYKTGLTAYFGSLLKISFEKAQSMAKDFQDALSKCCLQPNQECIIQEFTEFQKGLCDESMLGTMSEEFQKCCGKAPMDTLTCIENLKRQPQTLPDIQPISQSLCQPDSPQETERYLFQIGARQLTTSVPVITTALNHVKDRVEACCSDSDIQTCMSQKDGDVKKIITLLSKADEKCTQYFKLGMPAFKVMVEAEVQGDGDQAAAKAETLVDLSSACCFQHSPAQRCQALTEKLISYDKGAAV